MVALLRLAQFLGQGGGLLFGLLLQVEHGPAGLGDHFSREDLLLRAPLAGLGAAGVVLLPGGPPIVAARPILPTNGQGPPRGVLILVRALNEAEVAGLAKRLDLRLMIQPWRGAGLPADFARAREDLATGRDTYVEPLGDRFVGGYTAINDIYGKPALILRMDARRASAANSRATRCCSRASQASSPTPSACTSPNGSTA